MKLGLFVLLLVLMACCHTVSHAFAPSTVQLPILAKKINLNMIKQASRASREIANPLWIGPNFAKFVTGAIMGSAPMVKLAASTPPLLKGFLKNVYPWDLVMLILFQLTHKKFLKFAHKTQRIAWKWASFGEPQPWDKSILGFVCERCSSLSKVLAATYMVKVGCMVLARLGLGISADFPGLISRIVVTIFVAQFVDKFKSKFLRTFFPKVGESRRQSYIVNKTTSVAIWTVGVLVVCEMLSVFLKVPLSSTLAFGGVGGLALGLSLRDMAANFVGGMILLLNEPFTPGDMITFRSGRTLLVGRVERVGWAQTRMRGKDTRPTYVPNSHFVKAALTNMERITHRKYETTVPLRFQDQLLVPQVIENIKTRLQDINKLDTLSMPCRVSFVKMSTYSLDIEITCYFATKSVDEFLDLQQQANLEVLAAINECGAGLALPTSSLQVGAAATTAAAAAAATGALQTPSQAAEAAAAILVDGGAGIEAALDNPALEEIHQQQLLKQEREEAEDPLEVSESSVSRAKDDKDVQELADAVHDTPIRLSPSAAQHPMRRGSSSSSIVKTAKRTVIDGVEVEAADTRGVGGEGGQGSVEAAEEEEEDMESEMTPLQVVGGGDALKDMAQELELVDALRVVTPSQQQQQQQQQQQEEEMMMMLESDEELPLQGELQDLGGVGVFQAALLDAEQDLGLPVVDAEREMEMEEEESTLSTASIPDSTTTTPTAGATVAVAVAEEEAPRKQRKGTVIPPVYPEHKQVNTYAARSAVPTEAAAAAGIEESETRTSTTPSAPVHDVVANSGSSTGAENLNGIPDPMAVAAATATSLDASIGTSSGANIWQASMEAAGIRTNARQHIIDHAEIHGTTTASSSSSSSTTRSSSSWNGHLDGIERFIQNA
mmetsp:Transcript_26634/g.44514  ORF Transcript_26634/g.44514 Transcript_26634/m.44514 type:complete len:891 (+) Transcript_26634:51-2723(+)